MNADDDRDDRDDLVQSGDADRARTGNRGEEHAGGEHLVNTLVEMTGCDENQAAFLLEAAGNDLVMAAQLYQGMSRLEQPSTRCPPSPISPCSPSDGRSRRKPAHTSTDARAASRTPHRTRDSLLTVVHDDVPCVADEQQLRERSNRAPPRNTVTVGTHEALVQRPLPMPFRLIGLPFLIASRMIHMSLALANAASRRLLPGPIYRGLCRFLRLLSPGPRTEDPVAAAAEFITSFSAKYGERAPKWELTGWEVAAQKSQREGVFLFVYLHSARHHDSDQFCMNTLCSPSFVDYLNATFVSWGGDIRSPEAHRLALRLNVSRYPYCGLLAFSGSGTRLIHFSEGNIRPEALAEQLQRSLTEHGGILWEERLLREQREHDRRLREEQDADYERSLEADRLKELERQQREEEEARREALEHQQREEEEARQKALEREREREAEQLQARRREKKLLIAEEAVEAPEHATCVIRIRFPGGETHQRRFYLSDQYERVVDWVESLDCNPYISFSLSTTFPKRVLGPDDHKSALSELQFEKQMALVIVEDL